ncbi:hypothetical protein FAM09_28885 [Niastella caeni]|uniref:Uncharacterized protein n=1 Tax=Niastella caeni TaxID=2569763 RepID=A0A4S8HEQ0_9BACT|nr:hypothetical protein [Niastella caeni]THU31102.1 hypothetical protein FAM09_28885 [Niastella caeni]
MAITNFLFNPTTLAELTAFIAACIMSTGKVGWWQNFFFYLLITLSVETCVHYIPFLHANRYIVFGLFMIVQAGFFSLLFLKFLSTRSSKQMLFFGMAIFVLIYIYDVSKGSFTKDYYGTLARKGLSVYIVLFSCIYYRQLLRHAGEISPLREPAFWVVTGLFFNYFVTFVIFQMRDRLLLLPDKGLHIVTILMGVLNWIFYGCWATAFTWRKIQTR